MVFFLTRKCGQFLNDLLTFLTEEKQIKSNSSFNNSHTQIKVLEILFEKKIKSFREVFKYTFIQPIQFT